MKPTISGFIADGFTHATKEIRVIGRGRVFVGWCGHQRVGSYSRHVVTFAGSPGAPVHPACVQAIEDEQRRKHGIAG